jgi:hypothetical protein
MTRCVNSDSHFAECTFETCCPLQADISAYFTEREETVLSCFGRENSKVRLSVPKITLPKERKSEGRGILHTFLTSPVDAGGWLARCYGCFISSQEPYHVSESSLPSCHGWGMGSIPGHWMWGLWWYWGGSFLSVLRFYSVNIFQSVFHKHPFLLLYKLNGLSTCQRP